MGRILKFLFDRFNIRATCGTIFHRSRRLKKYFLLPDALEQLLENYFFKNETPRGKPRGIPHPARAG
jgi:hypothetical protein